MRSKIKPSPKARNSSAFWSKILGKDLFYVAYARNLRGNLHVKSKDLNGPEIYLRFYFPKIFLAKQHLKEDFLQDFLRSRNPKISVSSVCSVDLFRVPSVAYSECGISDDSGRLQLYSHLLLELLGLLASNLSEVATR